MTRSKVLLILSMLVITLITSIAGCTAQNKADLNVVASTSIIANIVKNIGEEHISVVNLIPPAQCPGHFDIKPGDITKLANAAIFFYHGWQGEKFSEEVISSANNPNLVAEVLNVEGNWMVPSVQKAAADRIGQVMSQVDSHNKDAYERNLIKYKAYIDNKEAEISAELAGMNFSGVNVLCADQQAGFIKWLGLNVVSTFGRPESLTPQIVQNLIDQGKNSGVVLVIDNLQSGPDAGKAIADELDCKRVVLSNFPGGFDGVDTWDGTIQKNIDIILTALTK